MSTRTLAVGAIPLAFNASRAAQSATSGALSSAADRAYRRHCGSNRVRVPNFGMSRPPSSSRPSRRIGTNGLRCFHRAASTGWPS